MPRRADVPPPCRADVPPPCRAAAVPCRCVHAVTIWDTQALADRLAVHGMHIWDNLTLELGDPGRSVHRRANMRRRLAQMVMRCTLGHVRAGWCASSPRVTRGDYRLTAYHDPLS